ncbi:Reverse transcriptase-like protein [Carex littledalei]|uniref:Reverse transcriptase-like protein n=1 Tax=Carex littledalei TaxID=544730 RepID=A0A833VT06_9POAL|nr:Reverse transcriptase-like protein [Carex littledalei]
MVLQLQRHLELRDQELARLKKQADESLTMFNMMKQFFANQGSASGKEGTRKQRETTGPQHTTTTQTLTKREVKELISNQLQVVGAGSGLPPFKKTGRPYPSAFDVLPYPQGYTVPKFKTLTGEGPKMARPDKHLAHFNVVQVLLQLSPEMDDGQWSMFLNSIWALWRCRNDGTYGKTAPSLATFNSYFKSIQWETDMGAVPVGKLPSPVSASNSSPAQLLEYTCFIDGSWSPGWSGGLGIVVFKNDELVQYRSAKAVGISPLMVEALALEAAWEVVKTLGISQCSFLSDCKVLVDAVSNGYPPTEVDWEAFTVILKLWEVFKSKPLFNCVHIDRSLNTLADRLAKLGRLNGWDCTGFTFPCFGA